MGEPSRQRSRFFERSRELLCILGRDGAFVDVNPSFVEALGHGEGELLGRSYLDFLHVDDREAGAAELRRLNDGAAAVSVVRRFGRKDGSVRWLHWSAVSDEEDGVIYATARDVTSDREREQTLIENEARLRLVIDGIRDHAVFMLDADGCVTTWNPGAERLKGFRSEEILGKHFSIFHTDEDRARAHPDDVLRRAAEGGTYEEEGWRVRKDGSRFWANVVLTASRDDLGAIRGYVKVTRDFTERQRVLEELAAREASLAATLEERGVLLQEIHHRVKNNLQVIASLMKIQMRGLVDATARDALAECRSRVEAIALIHEELYRSADSARVPFAAYVKNLVEGVFRAGGAPLTNTTLRLDLEDVALPLDQAIPCGLILNELVTNALKHAFPDGKAGVVHVELRRSPDGDASITVADDGVGMKAKADGAPPRSLGMRLVATLVEQLDGRMDVDASAGTRIRFRFPTEARR